MIPRERSLVQRLKNKPFVLLGINSDDERHYRSAVRDGGITWPNIFDGGGTGGPIATMWNVHGWPTIYVLDAKGVIRYKDYDVNLDEAVDKLLDESGVGSKPSSTSR